MSDITHRGWIIAPATIGYDIQHPDFDRENELDWRHGHTDTIEAARIEIDRLLTEDAEWTEAVSILKEGYTPKPPAGGDAGAVERLARIRTSMALLQQNSEGCALNHYGDDAEQSGMPGWLIDTKADLDAFTDHLAALALPAPVVEGDAEKIALAKLFKAAVDHMQDGWDWDGCDLQAACRQSGLIFERPYNAETDAHTDAEEGDTVWVPTDAGTRILDIARAALSEGRSHG